MRNSKVGELNLEDLIAGAECTVPKMIVIVDVENSASRVFGVPQKTVVTMPGNFEEWLITVRISKSDLCKLKEQDK